MAEEVRKSKVRFTNVNYHLASVYLGVTMDKARQVREGIAHLIPPTKAKTKKGRRLTVHTKELGGPRGRKVLGEDTNPIAMNLDEEIGVEDCVPEISKYYRFHRPYTEEEKRLILSKTVLMATETAFENHIYQCQNSLYRQLIGGGIGARLTGMVARVIMDVWMDKMSRILKENDV